MSCSGMPEIPLSESGVERESGAPLGGAAREKVRVTGAGAHPELKIPLVCGTIIGRLSETRVPDNLSPCGTPEVGVPW